MSTTYQLRSPKCTYYAIESGDSVLKSDIELLEHLPFAFVRDLCRAKGWQVIPMLDEEHPVSFVYKGIQYTVCWDGDRIKHITASDEDGDQEITWSQLPEAIKRML